jgi:hypothetical protein
MSKRRKMAADLPRVKPAEPRRRDPLTRIARYCLMLAMGLMAAAVLLRFPNELARDQLAAVPMAGFAGILNKAAILAVHTRAVWLLLAGMGIGIAFLAFRGRYAPRQHRLVRLAPLAAMVIVALHAGALLHMQSQGPLRIELHTTTGGMDTITRMTVLEGTSDQWTMFAAGDMLFVAPTLCAWLLRFVPERFGRKKEPGDAAVSP